MISSSEGIIEIYRQHLKIMRLFISAINNIIYFEDKFFLIVHHVKNTPQQG